MAFKIALSTALLAALGVAVVSKPVHWRRMVSTSPDDLHSKLAVGRVADAFRQSSPPLTFTFQTRLSILLSLEEVLLVWPLRLDSQKTRVGRLPSSRPVMMDRL